MSLYNMMHGMTQATFFILPMLDKHPDEYPRFRDCFLNDIDHPEYNDHIHVYTRVGGGNREFYRDEVNEICDNPYYITSFDDGFDCTFATYIFKIPPQWQKDYDLFMEGEIKDFSKKYQQQVRKIYPLLSEKLDELFGKDHE